MIHFTMLQQKTRKMVNAGRARESHMSRMLDMRKNKSLVKHRSLRVNTHEQ